MARTTLDVLEHQTFVQLQTLPGIGPATAGGLVRVGVTSLDDLSRRDPNRLAAALRAAGHEADGAVLHALARAVHYARTGTWQAAI